jgi:hypothetical protein
VSHVAAALVAAIGKASFKFNSDERRMGCRHFQMKHFEKKKMKPYGTK